MAFVSCNNCRGIKYQLSMGQSNTNYHTSQNNVINYFIRLKIVKWCLDLFREGAKNILRGPLIFVEIGNVYI